MIQETLRRTEVSHQNGLEQAIDRYKQSASFLVLSEITRLAYTADLTQFQKYCQAHSILSTSQPTPEDIANWRDQLKQGGYAPATINRKHSSLSTFLGWAEAEGLVRPDFTDGLLKYEKTKRVSPKTLTTEQENTLISKARSLRDASLILIALTTGATITEIVNLNVEDVVRTGDENTEIRFKGGVQKNQPRTLKVDKRVGSKIAEYIKNSRLKLEDPLFREFHNRHGGRGRLTRKGGHLILKRYRREIEVENLNPRMLRDTFIVNFTGSPRELSETLGRKR